MSLAPKNHLIQTLAHDSTTFGGGSAENGTAVRTEGYTHNVFAYKNTTNQAVTITFQGSYDSTFTDYWDITGSVALAAGNVTAQLDYETLSDAWPFVRCVFTPAGNPTAGSVKFWHFASED